MTQTVQDIFAQRLALLDAPVDARTAERLAGYHALLCAWNTRINLTGETSLETALSRLYMDSLAPLAVKGLFPAGSSVVDVGSGAGFPGLPLAIARPDLTVLLVDSLGKRVKFLQAVIDAMGLTNVQAVHARAEDAAWDAAYRERFDIAVARAVAAAPVLLEYLLPYVRVGGHAVCYKGPAAEEELDSGARAARILGGGYLEAIPVPVPAEPEWQHCVLACVKRRPTPAYYPRKAGLPAKEPLGTDVS